MIQAIHETSNVIQLFYDAINDTDNLEIQKTQYSDKGEVFVIEDSNNKETHIELLVNEVCEKVQSIKDAQRFVDAINNPEAEKILDSYSRIVGYFSKISNWNQSKIGELKGRQKGKQFYSVNKNIDK